MALDYAILILYALSMVGVAIYTKNRSGSVDDFLFAGKKGLGGWMTAFAYGTTYFSAVVFIGYAGQFGRAYGLAATWIGIANAIVGALLAWIVLAKRSKNMSKRLDSKTMPDFFEKRYGSRGLKIFSAIITFVFLIPYSASVYNGLSSLFEIVFGIPGWVIMICLAALTALYLFFGGYFATAVSDFIQGIVMIVGVILMVLFFMNSDKVNWDLSAIADTWFTFGKEGSEGLFGSTVSLISLIFLTSFGVWALPQTIHKYHSLRDKRAISQGIVVSTAFSLLIGFAAYFTGALSFFFPEALSGVSDAQVIPVMLSIVIPTGLTGVIAVLILSASMSTLSSVSLASASVIAIDLYKGSVNKDASDKRVNLIMRVLTLVFVAISVILAVLNEKLGIAAIAYMTGISWGTLAGCFIGPYVLGLVWKRVTKTAVWASMISTLVITATLIVLLGYMRADFACNFEESLKNGMQSSPFVGVVCMICSIVITAVVSLFTKAPDKKIISDAFDKEVEGLIK